MYNWEIIKQNFFLTITFHFHNFQFYFFIFHKFSHKNWKLIFYRQHKITFFAIQVKKEENYDENSIWLEFSRNFLFFLFSWFFFDFFLIFFNIFYSFFLDFFVFFQFLFSLFPYLFYSIFSSFSSNFFSEFSTKSEQEESAWKKVISFVVVLQQFILI